MRRSQSRQTESILSDDPVDDLTGLFPLPTVSTCALRILSKFSPDLSRSYI